MKYKIGDKVRIGRDLVVGERYGVNSYVDSMDAIATDNNYIFTIGEYVDNNKQYIMVEDKDGWCWTDEMIEGVVEFTDREKFEGWMRKLSSLNAYNYVWKAFNYCADYSSNDSEYDDNLKIISDYLFGAEKKKMTKAEIEAELGYEIEIVEE